MGDTLAKILHQLPHSNGTPQAMKMVTIRLPAELHAALVAEAHRRATSLNKLAIAKLALKAEVLDHIVDAQAALENGKCSSGSAISSVVAPATV